MPLRLLLTRGTSAAEQPPRQSSQNLKADVVLKEDEMIPTRRILDEIRPLKNASDNLRKLQRNGIAPKADLLIEDYSRSRKNEITGIVAIIAVFAFALLLLAINLEQFSKVLS